MTALDACILIVDDEDFVRESLCEVLRAEGCRTLDAADPKQAFESLSREDVDLVITDLQMKDGGGLALLERLRAAGHEMPVIVLSGVGTVDDAVRAMRLGAFDFVQKPVDADRLVRLCRHALERSNLVREVKTLRARTRSARSEMRLVGDSAAMHAVRTAVEQVAASEATVLVSGESGTGKELVAAEIHARSSRRDANLVRVNCAAIPESLFESEFFGHRRGSFSGAVEDRVGRFAEAEGGTLVLDEIGTLGRDIQAKLLRVLEGGEYQVVGESRTRVARARVIAVTNDDLSQRVEDGEFRKDLYYRLAIFPIAVPPLRDRLEDVGPIADELLTRLSRGRRDVRLSVAAQSVLESYPWPGNVRELRNVLERALIVGGGAAPDDTLLRRLLEGAIGSAPPRASQTPAAIPAGDLNLRDHLDREEMKLLAAALETARGKKKEAARLLGIDPRNLAYYLKKHQMREDGE